MLILILTDVQYSQKAVFSFEKGLNHQNHSGKKIPPGKISDSPPPPLSPIWKILTTGVMQGNLGLPCLLILLIYTNSKKNSSTRYLRLTCVTNSQTVVRESWMV